MPTDDAKARPLMMLKSCLLMKRHHPALDAGVSDVLFAPAAAGDLPPVSCQVFTRKLLRTYCGLRTRGGEKASSTECLAECSAEDLNLESINSCLTTA